MCFNLQFKSPVSNAWLLYKGELMTVDMFNNQNIPALSSFEQEERPQHPPLLYVGKRFLVLTQMRIGNNAVYYSLNIDTDQPEQTD